jgi:hypothetical protein
MWGNIDARSRIVAALGAALLTAAVATAVPFLTNSDASPSDSPAQTGGASASACPQHLRIATPTPGGTIANGKDGIAVEVYACGLGSDTGWLFDLDPAGDQTYYLDSSPPFAPIAPRNGTWKTVDQSIGSPGDINTPELLYLVDATPQCTQTLTTARPDANGNVSYKTLPPGCTIADSVSLTLLSYPPTPSN